MSADKEQQIRGRATALVAQLSDLDPNERTVTFVECAVQVMRAQHPDMLPSLALTALRDLCQLMANAEAQHEQRESLRRGVPS